MVVVGALVLYCVITARDNTRVHRFESIQIGMTEDNVIQLLGQHDDSMPRPYPGSYDPKELDRLTVRTTKIWYSNRFTAQIGFDEQGIVVWKGVGIAPVRRRERGSYFDWINRVFGF
jgi:hypothetical protein